MKHGDRMPEAARLLEAGLGEKAVASIVGVSGNTARKWAYAYRALGKEALLSGKRRTYSQSEKLEAVRLFLEDKIGFLDIGRLVEGVVDADSYGGSYTLEDVYECDRMARQYVLSHL